MTNHLWEDFKRKQSCHYCNGRKTAWTARATVTQCYCIETGKDIVIGLQWFMFGQTWLPTKLWWVICKWEISSILFLCESIWQSPLKARWKWWKATVNGAFLCAMRVCQSLLCEPVESQSLCQTKLDSGHVKSCNCCNCGSKLGWISVAHSLPCSASP